MECICPGEDLHRSRLGSREGKIPGWQELEWSEGERVRGYFLPWEGESLILDMAEGFEGILEKTVEYCERLDCEI